MPSQARAYSKMPVCDDHRGSKKGVCFACQEYRKCPPPMSCTTSGIHIRSGTPHGPRSLKSTKELLTAVGLSRENCKVPSRGFASRIWDRDRPGKSNAKSACLHIFDSLCQLLCPTAVNGMRTFKSEIFLGLLNKKAFCVNTSFSKYCKTFEESLKGEEYPEKLYFYRVPMESYASAIRFLKRHLER